MLNILAVGAGGFIGSVLRYLMNALPLIGTGFPLATLLVNVIGSFAIGSFSQYVMGHGSIPVQLVLFVQVGLCGGFTTFSSFSLESVKLIEQGHMAMAFSYIALSFVLCLAAAWAGIYLVKGIAA